MSPLLHEGRELNLVAGQTIFDYADALKIKLEEAGATVSIK